MQKWPLHANTPTKIHPLQSPLQHFTLPPPARARLFKHPFHSPSSTPSISPSLQTSLPFTVPSPAIKHYPPTVLTVEQSNNILCLCCSSFVLVYAVFLRSLPRQCRWPICQSRDLYSDGKGPPASECNRSRCFGKRSD